MPHRRACCCGEVVELLLLLLVLLLLLLSLLLVKLIRGTLGDEEVGGNTLLLLARQYLCPRRRIGDRHENVASAVHSARRQCEHNHSSMQTWERCGGPCGV